ncbi:MAG: U32 family peptidase [Treponema sp.]|nr:U32 family peptidase [Treponema sp.]
MELLSPAGNIDKLYYAYQYGADAAYIGLKKFSLRAKADNFYEDEYQKIIDLKKKFPGKRLHCALNISFHNRELEDFIKNIDYFKQYPIDAFIVQDMGIVPILQKEFPNVELHLSTQVSCMNWRAAKVYKDMGFKRVVLGREVSLNEVKEIKDHIPDLEIECFAHGAMCIAYSGRCLMSAYMTGRSAQSGLCTHTCRWNFRLDADASMLDKNRIKSEEIAELARSGALSLTEESRPDEHFPIFEGDNYTAILSSKDLCMVEHLADLKAAGVDSLKIEGRMKSIYYVALVTRAYRKALDALDGKITEEEARPYVDELYQTSHREFGTGFFYNRNDANKTVSGASNSPYMLCATVGEELPLEEAEDLFKKGQASFANKNELFEKEVEAAQKARAGQWLRKPDLCVPAVQRKEGWKFYQFHPLNHINCAVGFEEQLKEEIGKGYEASYAAQKANKTDGDELEFVGPDYLSKKAEKGQFRLVDPKSGLMVNWVSEGHACVLYTNLNLDKGTLVRVKDPDYKAD